MVQREIIQKLGSLSCYLLEVSPLVLSWQAGKKAVRAVLWVSADGLRVVDDKTKVISCFNLKISKECNR